MNSFPKYLVCLLSMAGLVLAATSCQDDEPLSRATQTSLVNTELLPNSYLSTVATYELGVGYSYDITAEWGQGIRYQIFDIVGLDKLQQDDVNTYVNDDFQEETFQEMVISDTRKDMSTKLALGGSIGLGIVGANVKVSGSYTKEDIENRKYTYGTMRIIHSIFTRDLQYNNVAVAASKATSGYFSPVFRKDWEELQAFNKYSDKEVDTEKLQNLVSNFLNRWGVAFISKAWMGGYLHYELAIESAYVSSELTVSGALEAEFAKVVEAKGSVSYKEKLTKISGHYSQSLLAAGGDIQLVSIITNDLHNDQVETSHIHFKEWTDSFIWGQGLLQDNCILANFRLVSIATLFDGLARTEIERQINEMKFNL